MMMNNTRNSFAKAVSIAGIAFTILLIYKSLFSYPFLPLISFHKSSSKSPTPRLASGSTGTTYSPIKLLPSGFTTESTSPKNNLNKSELLEKVLENASMKGKTVIITTLNGAWAEPNSVFDLFLESFRIGRGTKKLLKHLVVVCLDEKALGRCMKLHPHCYPLYTKGTNSTGEAYFMTPVYLEMMWRRIQFLTNVLKIGFDFVFTDADIMWFRDPFSRLKPNEDFQIASDYFRGNPYNVNNQPNGGFNYVKSNNKTIRFYEFWFSSRQKYPGLHDQDVLNKIKSNRFIRDIGLRIRFLETAYFGGFCEPSKDLNKVCTMHANCCFGIENKVYDLRILIADWKRFLYFPTLLRKLIGGSSWNAPKYCKRKLKKKSIAIKT